MADDVKAAPAAKPAGDGQARQEVSYLGARLREKNTYGGLATAIGFAAALFHNSFPQIGMVDPATLANGIEYLGIGIGIFIGIFLPEKGSPVGKVNSLSMGVLACALAVGWSFDVRPAEAATVKATAAAPSATLPCDPLNLLPGCAPNATSTAVSDVLAKMYDFVVAGGDALIADMQKGQGLAATKMPDGSTADAASSACLSAIIPFAQLIIQNAVPATAAPASGASAAAIPAPKPDGMVTAFVKLRIVVAAIQGASVQSGCAWLQTQLNQTGTQGLVNVLSGLIGMTKLPIPLPVSLPIAL
jgi:hypothetical protein